MKKSNRSRDQARDAWLRSSASRFRTHRRCAGENPSTPDFRHGWFPGKNTADARPVPANIVDTREALRPLRRFLNEPGNQPVYQPSYNFMHPHPFRGAWILLRQNLVQLADFLHRLARVCRLNQPREVAVVEVGRVVGDLVAPGRSTALQEEVLIPGQISDAPAQNLRPARNRARYASRFLRAPRR